MNACSPLDRTSPALRRSPRSFGQPSTSAPPGLNAGQIDEAVRLYAVGQSLARIGDRV
jgi:hypothetical protein